MQANFIFMKRLFCILSIIIFIIPFISCKSKIQEPSETYLLALSYYEEAFNKINHEEGTTPKDSLISSFNKFIEAARIIEYLPEDMTKDEICLTSKIYHQLSQIAFSMMGFNTQVDACKEALYYQEHAIDTNMMATLAADLALTYSTIGDDDELVKYYINYAQSYIDTTSDYIEPYLKTRTSLSTIYYYNENKEDSSFIIENEIIAFKHRRGLDTKRDSVTLGMLMSVTPSYEHKAKPYLLKVFETDEIPEVSRCYIIKHLADIYEEENNIDSMEFCRKHHEPYIEKENSRLSDEVYISNIYNNYKTERDAKIKTLREEKNKKKKRLIVTISLIVAVTTVASLTYIFRRNKKNLNKQKDIAGNALQQHVQMIYREQKDNMYQEILKEFTSVYPDALNKLKKTYPELTDTELSVCMLSFFSFRVKDIANILKLRENTVSKYRSSIIKKTEAKDITKIFGE